MALLPRRPKGPPLNALRAFEAAARLGGFAAAAEELCVTAGAVGQQIKKLEQWSGAPLFIRASQGVKLTLLGKNMAIEFGVVFDQLGLAVQNMRIRAKPRTISIAALPSVAQLWLSPLLSIIREAIPDARISITVLENPPNLYREQYDLSLFFERDYKIDGQVRLAREEIFPVCAPKLVQTLKQPIDLEEVNCLSDANWHGDWQYWIEKASPQSRVETNGAQFSLYSLAVAEAKNGAGILMGHRPLIDADLQTSQLIAPFSKRVKTDRWLVVDSTSAFKRTPNFQTILAVLKSAAKDGATHK